MFEVKLFEVINSKDAIAKMLDEKLPAVLARNLGKYFQIVEKEFAEFEKIRETKIKEYGEEGKDKDDKTQFSVKPDCMQKFLDELNELLSQDVSIPLKKIAFDEKLPALEPRTTILLNWIFEDYEDDSEKAAELQV